MENGEGRETRSYPTGELVAFAPNSIVTPEDYRANLERIKQVKAAVAFYEEQNQEGLKRFYDEKQSLEAAVEQGRLAAQRLAQLSGQPIADVLPAPTGPIAGPSNGAPSQFPPQYHARPQAFSEVEVPTSARIVEITSPQVGAHGASSSAHSSAHDNNFYHNQAQQRASTHAQRPHVDHYPNVTARQNGNMGNPQQPHIRRSFSGATSNIPPAPQQLPYQAGAWYPSAPSGIYDSRGVPQVPQPTYNHYAPPFYANYEAAAPPARVPPQFTHTENVSRQAPAAQASYQPRYGASTASSLDGALGAAPSSTPQSVPHAKVTYSSRANQSAGEASQPSNPPPHGDNGYQEQQLFAFFKSLRPAIVQQLMVQVLTVVKRKQSGRPKSADEEAADRLLDEKMLQAAEVIAEKLKHYSIGEINNIFIKYLNLSKAAREQIGTNIRHTTRTQNATAAQPTARTSTQPTPGASGSQPASASTTTQSRPAPPSSSAPPASVPAAKQSTAQQIPASSTQKGPEPPQLAWYVPKDPSAPIAYRDGAGQIRYVFRPQQAPAQVNEATAAAAAAAAASATAAANPPAVPSFVHDPSSQQPQTLKISTAEPPGTPEPVDIQPPSPWSPEKADRSRLAQDIMRSLGRPRGSFGEPLSSTSGTPAPVEEGQATANSKRKSPPSPRPSTPLKRQRTEEPDAAAAVSELALPTPDVIDLTSSTSEEDTTAERMRTTPDPGPESSDSVAQAVDESPHEEPGDATVVVPPLERESSAVSSESADLDKVQAMFAEPAVAGSVASGPPSSSPPHEVPDMVDLPSLDEQLFAADTIESLNALVPSSPSQPASDGEIATSSARGDKIPLFLPSPSSSPGASGSSRGGSPPASPGQDVLSDGEPAPRALYGHRSKGKGKARQSSVDIDLTSPPSSASAPPRRRSGVFIEVPPLPQYVQQLKEASPASTSASASVSESVDELAEWHEEEDKRTHEEEMQEVVQLAYDRMRESPCLWAACGAVLNSMSRLQGHAAQHASEHVEWGTYGCQWQGCTLKFADKTKLALHLRKHAKAPLPCTYDGCEKTFNTPEALLAHHKSSRHRNGTLRASTAPFAPAANRQALSPLPDALPAYMSVPRRVSRHPISKERHQWLGPKVLENITAFKYSGGRSNAALPPRGSRRLAEKVAAAELAGVTPEAALAQIQRWMDDEYLTFADGYDAARRPGLRCADIPSQEVTELVDKGLVLWPAEDDQKAEARTRADAGASGGPEHLEREGRDADGGADKDASSRPEAGSSAAPQTDARTSGGDGGGVDDSEVDQLADDVSDGPVKEGAGRAGEGREDAGGGDTLKLKLKLPRRSNVAIGAPATPVPGPGNPNPPVAVKREDGGSASPDRAMQSPGSQMQQHIPWPIWPPPGGLV